MARYAAIIESDGSSYGAWFPDCPGCVTMADSMDGVVEQAAQVLRLWADDLSSRDKQLPVPRSLESLRQDPDVADSFKRGGAAMLVPLLLDRGRPARANISLDRGLLEAIDEAAKARGLTRSAFLASAARVKIRAEP